MSVSYRFSFASFFSPLSSLLTRFACWEMVQSFSLFFLEGASARGRRYYVATSPACEVRRHIIPKPSY
jgi:hypothetical protein